ncbi:MAG: helix-turn-helix domain-containing protein [Rhodospirillaceae bacterium]|nr:helix-turn-helix domain-containing protein [Rhodospirillaceae bacterium]
MKTTLIVIEGDRDHAAAKALVTKLMGSRSAGARARLAAQARLIESYERSRWPRRAASLAEILTYLMDQHGVSRAGLASIMGGASRVSEVINGKRGLSLSMIRRLCERFDIPADVLIHATINPRQDRELAA